ncbi:MAG: glycosyl transferase family 2 [Nitrospirae bacterium CG_4_10_14_0_8_um_filter_41_23]|nr:glycosyl transferase family 2 [Nitrospirota bacterium]OIP60752.1 MAG: glycosyl transferase family 2 [Nitrospirae bacterium CG2_30_41_42]PIQ94397.1 MAG: glycosyl transferase family 2 [Nitrospirae bacterium CG11_big_fil_rev_8_21_14_0_20_41_14]PIV41788.1 MAG: glycosyl transferase family 2 [Nitrospirae bacterium CG02_land_8_20_14_3_00_41_53]PIW88278.1 MAG: glycosyl transferase family 2 [Nitrospirae bacterium CG_4_8_14_3_um_filter_41_47]PIY86347.1 MAG: glycosyl transferase family 2 [Nitrospirae 
MDSIILRKEIHKRIDEIKKADILVGIPSYNNARTIGHVVKAVQTGFAKYFPDKKCVLVNSDGGSRDGTMEVVKNTTIEDFQSVLLHHRVEPIWKIATPYHGIPGKGSAFRTIFEIADALNVKACAVVDSDLRSITPEWIELLIKPVLEGGFDYVSPLYHRHKYDGTITNSIVYPLTRALYGKHIRQPIGGDFGFSGKLASFYLTKNLWDTDVARYGIDIWMTTTAIANKFKICQAFLGAKIHDAKDPGADLSSMLYQVVGATFDLMETYQDVWKTIKGSEPVPTFGFRYDVGLEPISVNLERMIEKFRLGVKELMEIWKIFIPSEILDFLSKSAKFSKEEFHIPDELWVDIIYSFAIASRRKIMNREHLLKSLTPLYIGKIASFIIEAWDSSASEVEQKIERLGITFENKKDLLIENWQQQKGVCHE